MRRTAFKPLLGQADTGIVHDLSSAIGDARSATPSAAPGLTPVLPSQPAGSPAPTVTAGAVGLTVPALTVPDAGVAPSWAPPSLDASSRPPTAPPPPVPTGVTSAPTEARPLPSVRSVPSLPVLPAAAPAPAEPSPSTEPSGLSLSPVPPPLELTLTAPPAAPLRLHLEPVDAIAARAADATTSDPAGRVAATVEPRHASAAEVSLGDGPGGPVSPSSAPPAVDDGRGTEVETRFVPLPDHTAGDEGRDHDPLAEAAAQSGDPVLLAAAAHFAERRQAGRTTTVVAPPARRRYWPMVLAVAALVLAGALTWWGLGG